MQVIKILFLLALVRVYHPATYTNSWTAAHLRLIRSPNCETFEASLMQGVASCITAEACKDRMRGGFSNNIMRHHCGGQGSKRSQRFGFCLLLLLDPS